MLLHDITNISFSDKSKPKYKTSDSAWFRWCDCIWLHENFTAISL